MKKLRQIWESIVYAGINPGSAPLPPRVARWFGPLRKPMERFLSGGGAADDPLYLTNRTFGQQLRFAAVVAVPVLLLCGVVLGAGAYLHVREKPASQLTDAEIAAKMLPQVNTSDLHIASNRDLDVVDASLDSGSVEGTVRNNTNRAIDNATVIFDLADRGGSRLGAVAVRILHVDPKAEATFRAPVEATGATSALVREVRLH